jgi:hypothetical protein
MKRPWSPSTVSRPKPIASQAGLCGCGHAHARLRGALVVDAEASAVGVRTATLHLACGVAFEVDGAVSVGVAGSRDAVTRLARLARRAVPRSTPWKAQRHAAEIAHAHGTQRSVPNAVRIRGAPDRASRGSRFNGGAATSGQIAPHRDAPAFWWDATAARTLAVRRARRAEAAILRRSTVFSACGDDRREHAPEKDACETHGGAPRRGEAVSDHAGPESMPRATRQRPRSCAKGARRTGQRVPRCDPAVALDFAGSGRTG